MATEIVIPRLGWTMEEGTFIEWLKRDGETVEAGEPLFTLEGEKATQDVEAVASGVLRVSTPASKKGDVVKVGALIGWILAPGEEPPPVVPRSQIVAPETGSLPQASRETPGIESRAARLPGQRGPAVTPRAARLAIELGVSWTQLQGTGRNGRIRARDVIAAAQAAASTSTSTPLSPLRAAIARRLSLGAERVVPVTLTREADATALTRWRAQRKEAGMLAPSITELFVRFAAGALREHPALNAVWAGGEISSGDDVHVSIAIDTERGLVAPVLRGAHRLSLTEISERTRSLRERARSGALRADELEGGTFTITNLGGSGVDAFTPIVHHPQVAILGLGRIQRRPAVVGERLEARDLIWLSLTFDHRALDGAPAARFLEALCQRLARPEDFLEERGFSGGDK